MIKRSNKQQQLPLLKSEHNDYNEGPVRSEFRSRGNCAMASNTLNTPKGMAIKCLSLSAISV